MKQEPDLPPPVYRPREVAEAILSAATSQRRDVYVGGGGRAISAFANAAPKLFDLTAPPLIMAMQQRGQRRQHPRRTLSDVGGDGEERGSHPGFVAPFSVYTRLGSAPYAIAAGLGVLALLASGGRGRR